MRVIPAGTSGPIVEQIDEIPITVPQATAGTFGIDIELDIEQVVAPGSIAYAQFADPPPVIPLIIVGAHNPTAGKLVITTFALDNYAGGTVPLHYSLKEHGQ